MKVTGGMVVTWRSMRNPDHLFRGKVIRVFQDAKWGERALIDDATPLSFRLIPTCELRVLHDATRLTVRK